MFILWQMSSFHACSIFYSPHYRQRTSAHLNPSSSISSPAWQPTPIAHPTSPPPPPPWCVSQIKVESLNWIFVTRWISYSPINFQRVLAQIVNTDVLIVNKIHGDMWTIGAEILCLPCHREVLSAMPSQLVMKASEILRNPYSTLLLLCTTAAVDYSQIEQDNCLVWKASSVLSPSLSLPLSFIHPTSSIGEHNQLRPTCAARDRGVQRQGIKPRQWVQIRINGE